MYYTNKEHLKKIIDNQIALRQNLKLNKIEDLLR